MRITMKDKGRNCRMWDKARIEAVLAENARRNDLLKGGDYDPMRGVGCCGERSEVKVGSNTVFIPSVLVSRVDARMTEHELEMLRISEDFEYWCVRCVKIKDKRTSLEVPFVLNRPQRRVLAVIEEMRTKRKPIRLIMLKARQWGGSTLVQIYMAWMQLVHHVNWNSLICGHLKDTSVVIKGMYSRLLRNYPEEVVEESCGKLSFKNFEGSRNVCQIAGRGCLVIAGSAESQESVRGFDIAMAHLSEVSFWRNTEQKSPESLIRAVCGAITLEADTMVVLESTANGVGNYFHREWLRAKSGESDKTAVFVPWQEIELYRRNVDDAAVLWAELDDYEKMLWERGCTLEMIAWYHEKRKEYITHAQMKAEYPTDDIEAFINTGDGVFDMGDIERFRESCMPAKWTGDIVGNARSGSDALRNIRFVEMPKGQFYIWKKPEMGSCRHRYIVTVDVGGISEKSDYSVIAVIDRKGKGGLPEVVAQWRGHTYHDFLAWKSVQIAQWYDNALLVVESNTLETEFTEGDGSGYILDTIKNHYRNLYSRKVSPDTSSRIRRLGFHTNVRTKEKIIYHMMGVIRDGTYVEHDDEALKEYSLYERKPNGSFGAKLGNHDDILMTRAIALSVCNEVDGVETLCDESQTLRNQ